MQSVEHPLTVVRGCTGTVTNDGAFVSGQSSVMTVSTTGETVPSWHFDTSGLVAENDPQRDIVSTTQVTAGLIAFTWAVPVDDGGGAGLSHYAVSISHGACPSGGADIPADTSGGAVCTVDTNTITIDRLLTGTEIQVSIQAVNDQGASLSSRLQTFSTAATATHPRAPAIALADIAGAGTASVTVDLPRDMGGASSGALRLYVVLVGRSCVAGAVCCARWLTGLLRGLLWLQAGACVAG